MIRVYESHEMYAVVGLSPETYEQIYRELADAWSKDGSWSFNAVVRAVVRWVRPG